MFYSYIGRRHKKKFMLMSSLKVFQLQKEACGYAKRKVLKKWTSV
jgi:hypothetical protein